MNRLVLLVRLFWLSAFFCAPSLVSAEQSSSGGVVVSLVGAPVAPPNELYPLNVVVNLAEGVRVTDLTVTNELPTGLVLNGYVAPPGTVFTPLGSIGIWRIGNVTGSNSFSLNLVFQGRPAGEIFRFRSSLGFSAGPTNDPNDAVARMAVVFQPQIDCVGIPGILARWRGERNARDSVGNYDGVLQGFPMHGFYTNGQSCRSFYFDGAGGGVYVPHSPGLEFSQSEDLSTCAWINLDLDQGDIGNLAILDKREAFVRSDGNFTAVGYSFSLFRSGNRFTGKWVLEFQLDPGPIGSLTVNNRSSSGPDLHDGRWHHVAATVRRGDADGGRFFIDGRLVDTFDPRPFNGDLRPEHPPLLKIGLHAVPGFPAHFKGMVDDVALYRRALTDAEIVQSYHAGIDHDCCRNIGLTFSVTNQPVPIGVPFNVLLRASRTPGRPPTDLVITNDLPAGLILLSAFPQLGSYTNIGQRVIWNLGSLGTEDSATLRLRLAASGVATNFMLSAVVGYSGLPDDDTDDDQVNASVESTGLPECKLLAGLLGWWPGNESNQDIVNTNRGVPSGTVGYTNGIVHSGFVFDGKSGVLGVGDPAEFHLQDLSIEAWIRRGDKQKATAIGSGGFFFASDTGGYGFGLLDDGRLMLSQVGLSFVPSSRGITETTNWHHVAVTKSGTKVVFYLDGAAITSTNLAGQFVFNRPFALGGLGGQVRNIFLGDIDELSIFNRPLSAAEITGIYDAGSRGKCRTGLALDESSEGNLPCQIRYTIENNGVLELVFLTLPDSILNLESSTNLMNWVPVRRLSDAGGEVRNLIKTNVTLYYRCLSNP